MVWRIGAKGMATIIIERVFATSASLVSAKVKVDGEMVGRVKSGSMFVTETTPGLHQVRAQLFWQASKPVAVDLADDDAAVTLELTTSADPDKPESLAVWRGLRGPDTAFSLRFKRT